MQAFWGAVEQELAERVTAADRASWFQDAEAHELSATRFVLVVPNEFAVRWIERHFLDALVESVAAIAGANLDVQVIATPEPGPATDDERPPLELRAHRPEPRQGPEAADGPTRAESAGAPDAGSDVHAREEQGSSASHDEITEDELRRELGTHLAAVEDDTPAASDDDLPSLDIPLNDAYRFDTFVIGEGNQLAHAAALSVAEAPAQSYNPLFIYGSTGLGKTHLLHAIGHYARATQPGVRIAYITTEQFIVRFIRALQSPNRNNARQEFKQYFRGIDILLVDDVQFLSDKGASLQEEFFHTFNALIESGRQIVLTSDREPSSIPHLEERLRSRFAWGLITDIARPDRETRIAILHKKAHADGLAVDDEVLAFIGERVSSNVRELEGALTRVVAAASLTARQPSIELARKVLATLPDDNGASKPLTISDIQQIVCDRFDLSHDDIIGSRRSKDVARPRQIAMYLSRTLLNAPSTRVGQQFGGKDHTTVLHAHNRVEELIREDPEVFDVVEELTSTIRSMYGRVTEQR